MNEITNLTEPKDLLGVERDKVFKKSGFENLTLKGKAPESTQGSDPFSETKFPDFSLISLMKSKVFPDFWDESIDVFNHVN